MFQINDIVSGVIIPCVLGLICAGVSVVEYFVRAKKVFPFIYALVCAASAFVLLYKSSGLCGFLIFILISLVARLLIEIIKVRKEESK